MVKVEYFMDAKATVQALFDAVHKGEFDKARFLLADDFLFLGSVPEPINGDARMGLSINLYMAFFMKKFLMMVFALF